MGKRKKAAGVPKRISKLQDTCRAVFKEHKAEKTEIFQSISAVWQRNFTQVDKLEKAIGTLNLNTQMPFINELEKVFSDLKPKNVSRNKYANKSLNYSPNDGNNAPLTSFDVE